MVSNRESQGEALRRILRADVSAGSLRGRGIGPCETDRCSSNVEKSSVHSEVFAGEVSMVKMALRFRAERLLHLIALYSLFYFITWTKKERTSKCEILE